MNDNIIVECSIDVVVVVVGSCTYAALVVGGRPVARVAVTAV